jgi:hypothetical protein
LLEYLDETHIIYPGFATTRRILDGWITAICIKYWGRTDFEAARNSQCSARIGLSIDPAVWQR